MQHLDGLADTPGGAPPGNDPWWYYAGGPGRVADDLLFKMWSSVPSPPGSAKDVAAMIVPQASPAARAEPHPSFAGTWRLIAERSAPRGAGGFGEAFSAIQDATSVHVAWHLIVQQGPGAAAPSVERPIDATYRFDGARTNVEELVQSDFSRFEIFSTASWQAEALVLLSMTRDPKGLTTQGTKQVLSIGSDGALLVETTGGRSSPAVRNYYRR